MTYFPEDFEKAFNHAMLYEVGGFWNPKDPDVISGAYVTREQRKKVGYVNIPADRGGETKYGIAQNANTDIVVRNLNLAGAMKVYYERYWLTGYCDKLPYPVTVIHFDGCVNHGVRRACRFLQKAVGVEQDGIIGPATLRAVAAKSRKDIIQDISNYRADFYLAIVRNNPSQKMFINGWMRRINEVTAYTLEAVA